MVSEGPMQPPSLQVTSCEPAAAAYRSTADRFEHAEGTDGEERMHPIVLIVGLASLARVVGALFDHEVFGAEATIALMTSIAVAWYATAVRMQRRAANRAPSPVRR
jgi:hypothetical protein